VARLFYNLIFTLAIPFILIRMWLRGASNPGYRQRWAERFGLAAIAGVKANGILVHTVSVGETLAAVPMVRGIQQQFPDKHITITTTTPTGSDQVLRIYKAEIAAGTISHCYLPYDLPWLMALFLRKVNPSLAIIMETELWPNFIRRCNQLKVPVLLANARLSERSAKGYRKLAALTAPMLNGLSLVAAQHRDDGRRFIELGLDEQKVDVTGSIKFDISVPADSEQQGIKLRQQWGDERPVLLLGSSHEGEDDLILDCYQQLVKQYPDLILVLVPRHPERFDSVAAIVLNRELELIRRSESLQKGALQPNYKTQVYLADTMGEMMLLQAAADICIIGGSFIEHGGHNPLEACALGKTVVMGPSDFNFAAISEQLRHEGAMQQCQSNELAACVAQLFAKPAMRTEMGAAAQRVVAENQGAVEGLLSNISHLLKR